MNSFMCSERQRNLDSMNSASMNSAAIDCSSKVSRLFDNLFLESTNTRLSGGASEPLYEPASSGRPAVIWFRENYFSSALHEVAHWCIAGERRRQQIDYGYWYAPDGRSVDQQQAFLAVEARPQALEWIFARAANHRFRISQDNLNSEVDPSQAQAFERAVIGEAQKFVAQGLPRRAHAFCMRLIQDYNGLDEEGALHKLASLSFDQSELR